LLWRAESAATLRLREITFDYGFDACRPERRKGGTDGDTHFDH